MCDESAASSLNIRLFGVFHASQNGVSLRGLHLREGERLLAYLILKAGEPVTTRELAKWFWPSEAQINPVGQEDFPSVRQSLHSLRQALGADAFRLTRPQRGSVAFDLTNATIDLSAFEQAVRDKGDGAYRAWASAVEVYTGPLLNGWGEVWAIEARARKKRAYEFTLRRLAEYALSQQDRIAGERWMRLLLVSRPDDDVVARELLRLLREGGRYSEAREVIAGLDDAVKASGRTLDAEIRTLALPPQPSLKTGLLSRPSTESPLQAGDATLTRTETQPEFALLPIEPAGGAVPTDSSFYVVRDTDAQFHSALARRDSIVLIKGARQVGKTSLLARGLQTVRSSDVRVITTDFQQFNETQFATPETLLLALATTMALQLELDVSPRQIWDADYSPNMNLELFLRRHVLRAFPEPLIWGMDEVDRLFGYSYSGEIFGLFRSWHNARSLDPAGPWSRLTLAITYATEAHLFITDLNQSPFNVGTRLALDDFSPEQIATLNFLYGKPLPEGDIVRFHALVGGHPYLVRRGLDEAARCSLRVEQMESEGERSGGIFEDHLHRLVTVLSRSAELSHAVRELLGGRPCPSVGAFYRLRTAGILAGASSQEARFRCRLYASYFAGHLF